MVGRLQVAAPGASLDEPARPIEVAELLKGDNSGETFAELVRQRAGATLRGPADQPGLGADISYATAEGGLYLACVLDLASRRIVGWSMSERCYSARMLMHWLGRFLLRDINKGATSGRLRHGPLLSFAAVGGTVLAAISVQQNAGSESSPHAAIVKQLGMNGQHPGADGSDDSGDAGPFAEGSRRDRPASATFPADDGRRPPQ